MQLLKILNRFPVCVSDLKYSKHPKEMATEQYLQESTLQNDFNGKNSDSIEKWNSISSPVDKSDNNSSSDFECNICLDSVHEPVVTICGHLFCWPCIYKWINFQNPSTEIKEPQCPVCKTEVSQRTLIPLYGRGQTTKQSQKSTKSFGLTVPQRPRPSCGSSHSPRHHQSYLERPPINVNLSSPGMFGEMVYHRIFGNSETLYTYPNSYNLAVSYNPRLRRHLMQADQSLGRVCFFLLCCVVLCLLLF